MSHHAGAAPTVELSIIIVNWNSKDYLEQCLRSVVAHTRDLAFEVIVVDSGSFDGCGEMLGQRHPTVRFLQSHHNVGFASANNMGARMARGDVLLFLNPDTELHGNAILRLHSALEVNRAAGVLGPKLLNTDGSLQVTCVQALPTILNQLLDIDQLHRWFPKRRLWTNAAMFDGRTGPESVEAISGACMMIRREVFDRVGGFSEDYFMYAEDLDLCWKVGLHGFKNLYVPSAEVVHHGGGSTRHGRSHFSEVMVPESVSRLLRKTRGEAYRTAYRWALSIAALLRLLVIAISYPAGLVTRRTVQWNAVFRKWVAVLRWGLGLEAWVKRYGHPD